MTTGFSNVEVIGDFGKNIFIGETKANSLTGMCLRDNVSRTQAGKCRQLKDFVMKPGDG